MSTQARLANAVRTRAAPTALAAFAVAGICGGWQGMPASLLLFGFAVLPGVVLLGSCRDARADASEPSAFAGPGVVAAALSVSLVLQVGAVFPLFAAHLPLATARWTFGCVLLVLAVLCARRRVVDTQAAGATSDWLTMAFAVALLLPTVLKFAGGTIDDWWDLAFVRSYAEHAYLSFAEPVLGTGRVHPRFAWNGWLVLQALVASFSGRDPVDLQSSLFPALSCIATVSATAVLARALFRRSAAVRTSLFFLPLWLWGTEAIPFFTRLHQDKFVAGLVLVPVMLAGTLTALERRGLRFRAFAAVTFIATASVHGVVFAVAALGVVLCAATAVIRASHGATQDNVREVSRRAAAVLALLLITAAYPAWQAWSVRSWFSAEGISLAADDNPVVRAHLGLERLLAPGSPMYVVHPGAVFGPIAIIAFVAAIAAWRRRRARAAAYLVALTVGPCALLFIPGLAALAGMVFVPWMLYRVGWLVPVPQLCGWLFEHLWRRRDIVGRASMAMVAVLALFLGAGDGADRLRRDMTDHAPRRERSPRGNERSLFLRVREWPEAGAVLAPPGISTLVSSMTGRATVATSERGTVVFSGDEINAYQRLRDRADFFALATDVSVRERIARRYGVRLIVFRKHLAVEGGDRDWLWRSGPEGFLTAASAEGSAQWTTETLANAIPPTWVVVFENRDFALVRTPYGVSGQVEFADGPSAEQRSWIDVFAPDAPEPRLSSPVLASAVAWPGGRVRFQPVPAALGSSDRPVWLGGGEVWDDAPETVTISFDLGGECKVDGVELIPFLRTRRREVLELTTRDVTRRLRAVDGVPLHVHLPAASAREVTIRVRSMVGEAFAFSDVRVHGDAGSCRRDPSPASRPDVGGGKPDIGKLVRLTLSYPNDARADVGLARRLATNGSRGDARALLRGALLRDAGAGPVWLELGLLNDADGDAEAARRAYRRALFEDSNSAWAHGCVAWAELRRSRRVVALYHAWRASQLDPRYADAFTIMGAATRALHLSSVAHSMFRRAIRLDRLRVWPYLELARLQADDGDTAAAVHVLQSFLVLVPDDEQARALLSRLTAAEPAASRF